MNNPKHTLPNGWSLKKLGEVFNITSGTTPSRAVNEYFEKGTHLWVKTTDLNNHFINDTQEKVTDLAMKETSLKKMPVGTVLVAMYGGFNQIGRTGLLQKEASVNQALSAILPNYEVVEPYFLLNWLNCKIEDWKGFAASSRKDPNITKSDVVSFPIILPPLPEQQKIAAILGTWDTATQTATALLAQLEKRKKGLMQQLLSPKTDWKEVRLGEIGSTFNGITGKSAEDFGRGKPYITYLNIFKNTIIDLSDVGLVDISQTDNQNEVRYGDIFFTVSSETPDEVGMSSVFLRKIEGYYLNSFCFGFRLNDFETLLPEFAGYLFRCREFRIEMYKLAQGSTRFNISKGEVVKLKINLPPLAEQIRIAEILNAADAEIRETKAYLEQLKAQKRGLMQQLLTGKVRVKTT